MLKSLTPLASLVAFCIGSTGNAMTFSVSPGGTGKIGTITDLGYFQPGTYAITGSGTVDLLGEGARMTIDPDGKPAFPVTGFSYSYFNPDGSYIADGQYGVAGENAKIGALIGTLSQNPTSADDWFLIGYSKIITLLSASNIFASVNDTYHQNNIGSFTVSVEPIPDSVTSVPEPGAMAGLVAFSTLLFLGKLRQLKS